jgi:hypothetical protein
VAAIHENLNAIDIEPVGTLHSNGQRRLLTRGNYVVAWINGFGKLEDSADSDENFG